MPPSRGPFQQESRTAFPASRRGMLRRVWKGPSSPGLPYVFSIAGEWRRPSGERGAIAQTHRLPYGRGSVAGLREDPREDAPLVVKKWFHRIYDLEISLRLAFRWCVPRPAVGPDTADGLEQLEQVRGESRRQDSQGNR